jgi:type II secretory pathway predicted ATPase ExeA
MDLAHFGLTRRPFRPTPDTDAYFPAPAHEAALTALGRAYEARDGWALVDGEPGTGKTIVVRKFLDGLEPAVAPVFLPSSRFLRPADLYQAILFDHGAEYHGLSEQELRLRVTDHLLGRVSAGEPTVLVLDEAQGLGPDVLEELRLLGNIETRSAKAAFIVLAAQVALRERLATPDLAAFGQRIAVRCKIEPLGREDSGRFLLHQLEFAGGRAGLITDEALNLITEHGRGVPRVLNQAAALAFQLAASAEAEAVDTEAAWEALVHLGLAAAELGAEPVPAKVRVGKPAKSRSAKRKAA